MAKMTTKTIVFSGSAIVALVGAGYAQEAFKSGRIGDGFNALLAVVPLGLLIAFHTLRSKQRRAKLTRRFGAQIANAIMAGRYWQGATFEMIQESLGKPVEIKESIYKGRAKHTYGYGIRGKNRYALRVHFENGVVVGWDQS